MNDTNAIRFADGEASIDSENYSLDVGTITFGDLEGNGTTEAAAVVTESGGGSGAFRSLVAVKQVKGAAVGFAHRDLGDRTIVNSIGIGNRVVTVNMTEHGPNDGYCCPTKKAILRVVLRGGEFVDAGEGSTQRNDDEGQSVQEAVSKWAEPQPVAFVRHGQEIGLVDADGVIFAMPSNEISKHRYSFPVVTGIDPLEPLPARKDRMVAFGHLVSELDSNNLHLSEQISEVDLTDPKDLRVLMAEEGADILAHFGNDHFLKRYQ